MLRQMRFREAGRDGRFVWVYPYDTNRWRVVVFNLMGDYEALPQMKTTHTLRALLRKSVVTFTNAHGEFLGFDMRSQTPEQLPAPYSHQRGHRLRLTNAGHIALLKRTRETRDD